MFTLLVIGITSVVGATVVVVRAIAAAPEGYEDHAGFHLVTARSGSISLRANRLRKSDRRGQGMPPIAISR